MSLSQASKIILYLKYLNLKFLPTSAMLININLEESLEL